ncbi:MAG: UDP-3-O-acyl-N-acetylglucosamine deacetylase, partial [Syntrophales bacterium]|nr:UDP-3-O-acyl-N-acetylglucosamine deacetylase [Syntrophales bacterium]
MPIIGHFVAYKSGHRLNNQLLRELINREDCWSIVSQYDRESSRNKSKPLILPTFGILDAVQARAPRRIMA